jgi:hypothetical protein
LSCHHDPKYLISIRHSERKREHLKRQKKMLMLTGYVVSDDNIVRPVGKETSSYPFATHLEQNEVHGGMVEFGGLAKILRLGSLFRHCYGV